MNHIHTPTPSLNAMQAAEYLGFTKSTLANSRYNGVLGGVPAPKFRKLGKSIRYSVETLNEWLFQFKEQNNTAQSQTAA